MVHSPAIDGRFMEYILVLCTINDIDCARKISRLLAAKKLIACANIIPNITSIYEWNGEISEDSECLMILKSRKTLFNEIKQEILKLHPYEVPEVISVKLDDGTADYLDWISFCTANNKEVNMSKTLVAYFSASGVTKSFAQRIVKLINADSYEITPAIPYTDADLDWTDKNSRSTVEMKDYSSRPAIAGKCMNIADYDTILLGFPIWWYIAPTIINTFLESYDFAGKTIVPFCTSGGSGVGETDKWLRESAPNAVWKPSKRFSTRESDDELKKYFL